MNGIIFDIKEFSIHDGPGGRITVFLKGCPLRCKWCHNPEGLLQKKQIMWKKNLCSQCMRCYEKCGHEECKEFDRCVYSCPYGAIEVSGKDITSSELATIINKNADMLKSLGGGVTFSGGEPLLQADFLCDVIDKLPHVHTAIQTSGYAEIEIYRRVIEKVDYIMQDIKLADDEQHIKYTGVSNKKILKNIEYLKRSGKEFIFRTPLIPGITDTEDNLSKIKEIVGDIVIPYATLNDAFGLCYNLEEIRLVGL